MTWSRPVRWSAAALFVVGMAVWTWKLLESSPFPADLRESLGGLEFFAAKGAHVGAYAFLAVLGHVWMPCRWGRMAVCGFLVLHGIATEVGQSYVPNRYGNPVDVVIDWVGILGGVVAYRLFERYHLADPGTS